MNASQGELFGLQSSHSPGPCICKDALHCAISCAAADAISSRLRSRSHLSADGNWIRSGCMENCCRSGSGSGSGSGSRLHRTVVTSMCAMTNAAYRTQARLPLWTRASGLPRRGASRNRRRRHLLIRMDYLSTIPAQQRRQTRTLPPLLDVLWERRQYR